ncbi:hypothetical protein Pcinc_030011 [Petrolisthes cinctipes]|uniref:B3/B4 tRNA-binding domain-containing protein n=1 Tax=Petrolisthes cinctipes TaxID=88211 RepID=A0AAE1EZS5_PETCI|nr:hypothetical protein Pcinc_030011 [Petrolisthes cinctipes]
MNLSQFIVCSLNFSLGVTQKLDMEFRLDNFHMQGFYEVDGLAFSLFPIFGDGTYTLDVNNAGFIGGGKLAYNPLTDRATVKDVHIHIFFSDLELVMECILGCGDMADLINDLVSDIAPAIFNAVWNAIDPILTSALENGINDILKNISISDLITPEKNIPYDLGNANGFMDVIMSEVDQAILNQGLDPAPLPDTTLSLGQSGSASVYSGEVMGLSTLHRDGTCTLDLVAGWMFLYANIAVEQLKVVLLGDVSSGVSVSQGVVMSVGVERVSVYMVARQDVFLHRTDIDQFIITEFGHIDVTTEGLGVLGHLAGALGEAVANLVKQALEEKRYELVLTGEDVNKRILTNINKKGIVKKEDVNKKGITDNQDVNKKEITDNEEDVNKKGITDKEDVNKKGITENEEVNNPQLDPSIYQLQQLNFLRVSGTPLTILGDGISNLINLTNLTLQGNKLRYLPESVEKLEKLKFLDVSGNLLEALPPGVAKISTLTSVNASNNKLTSLPDFEGCVNLSVLDARNNVLEEFPGICYESLVHLSEVWLGSNCLNNIPGDINILPTLKLLQVSDNKVNIVPGELAGCPKLKELDLKGNPLSDRRFKKLVESERCIPRQVLDYIKQHCPLVKGDEGKKGKKGKGGKGKQKEKDEIDELCDEIQVLNQRDDLLTVQVDVEVKKVRPYIVCCVLKNLNLQQDNLRKFIDLQTKLHEGACEKRLAATIATHDLKKVQGPVRYQARPPADIKIHPLVRGKVVSARELYQGLKQDAHNQRKQQKRNAPTGIHKYLHIVEKWTLWPCLVDATGTVISLPPLTNSENTKISCDTTDILVEVTSGTSLTKAKEVMNALVFMTHKLKLNNNNNINNTASNLKEEVAEGKQDLKEEVAEGKQDLKVERNRVILKVEQVKVEEEETGQLRVLYPSRVDLTNHSDNIRVVMPGKY